MKCCIVGGAQPLMRLITAVVNCHQARGWQIGRKTGRQGGRPAGRPEGSLESAYAGGRSQGRWQAGNSCRSVPAIDRARKGRKNQAHRPFNRYADLFARCLHEEEDYDVLYAGLDYHFNDETDLNFNLSHAALGRALQRGPAKIYFG